MDLNLRKRENYDYEASHTGIVETDLSVSDIESQVLQQVVDEYDVHSRNVRLNVELIDIDDMEDKKVLRIDVNFSKNAESEETFAITLREYAE